MTERTLRAATWNVHGLRGGVEAVAAAIRAEELDVVFLQESGPRRQLRELERLLGWAVTPDPPVFPRRRIQNALLTRPGATTRLRPRSVRFARSSLLHPRGALIVEVDERWTAVSAHLGLDATERGRHVAELRTLIGGGKQPVVLGVDLNVRPGEPSHTALAGQLTDVWTEAGEGEGATFPSVAPTARIDYLFVGPAVQALRAWTAGGTVSDHLMVVADLRLG